MKYGSMSDQEMIFDPLVSGILQIQNTDRTTIITSVSKDIHCVHLSMRRGLLLIFPETKQCLH